jgi:hypothetical protein
MSGDGLAGYQRLTVFYVNIPGVRVSETLTRCDDGGRERPDRGGIRLILGACSDVPGNDPAFGPIAQELEDLGSDVVMSMAPSRKFKGSLESIT